MYLDVSNETEAFSKDAKRLYTEYNPDYKPDDKNCPQKDEGGDKGSGGSGGDDKDKKKDEKPAAGKAGERGTNKEFEKCDWKKEGSGCVEKMCCSKITGFTLPDTMKENKEEVEKGFEEAKKKSADGPG
jgi:hypothetical protein